MQVKKPFLQFQIQSHAGGRNLPENVHMIVFCKGNLKRMKFKLVGSIHQSEEEEKEEQACEAEEVQSALY